MTRPAHDAVVNGRARVLRPCFVGRARELTTLATALSGSQAATVLVEGEAGMGKSRLGQEYLAGESASRALIGGCLPLGDPSTLGPIVDALRHACDGVAALPLSALAGALRPLFPEWAAALPPAPEPLDDAPAARHRLFRAMAELIGCLDATVLIVEDVHWADEPTLEFLLYLATRQARHGPHLLLTYRPEDVPADSLLHRLMSRAVGTTRIALEPLDTVSTAQFVSSMLDGQRVSPEFAAFVHHCTDGLPLAVEESVRLLHDRGDLVQSNGEWVSRSVDHVQVPATIRDSVQERARRLSAAAQRILQAAAVLSDPATGSALATLAGLEPDETAAGLAGAVGSGLLREDGTGRVMFRHVLAATALYESIPAPLRADMHRRAVLVLQAAPVPPLAQLIRHCRAGDGDPQAMRISTGRPSLTTSGAANQFSWTTYPEPLEPSPLPARYRTLGRSWSEGGFSVTGGSGFGFFAAAISRADSAAMTRISAPATASAVGVPMERAK